MTRRVAAAASDGRAKPHPLLPDDVARGFSRAFWVAPAFAAGVFAYGDRDPERVALHRERRATLSGSPEHENDNNGDYGRHGEEAPRPDRRGDDGLQECAGRGQ